MYFIFDLIRQMRLVFYIVLITWNFSLDMILEFQIRFKWSYLRNSAKQKIDFFSVSNVVFLKVHIKISYLAKFGEFWSSLL